MCASAWASVCNRRHRRDTPALLCAGFIVFPLLWLLNIHVLRHHWRYTDWIYTLTHIWLLYYYISLSLRENILKVVRGRPPNEHAVCVRRWAGGSARPPSPLCALAEPQQHSPVVDLPPLHLLRHVRHRADVAGGKQVRRGVGGPRVATTALPKR